MRHCRQLVGKLIALACSVGWTVVLCHHAVAQQNPAQDKVDYSTQIKPLLARCYACHGGLKQEAGLRLDTAASAIRGGETGPAIMAGKSDKSLLMERVSAADAAERMPPEHEGEPFTPEQIALLRTWIDAGAHAPQDEQPEADPHLHWAFQPIVRPSVPAVQRSEWVRNPIDAFIAEQQEKRGLEPQPEARPGLLFRRLHLDLVGVPPTPKEIAAFLSDTSPAAYERSVDRLLNDPRHGQRWGRHWMDIWRYSDWWGLDAQLRNSQPHIWHWRDWIIESLNANVGYDEMVRLMLAADELHPKDLNHLRASGYLARNYFLFNRTQWMDDTVEHVAKGFLGLTANCAKCHDHKYDPISQVDYYRLRAFFEPYQVRIDMLPGEADLSRNGLPRAFDGLLNEPTYRLIRGQENQPDKSAAIAPGIPSMLDGAPLTIEPVALPVEAWQPERREWVVANYRASAQQELASATSKLDDARAQLAAAQQRAAEVAASSTSNAHQQDARIEDSATLVDKFAEFDERRWKTYGGKWQHQKGKLEQQQDGATRSIARLLTKPPRDFDASLRFTIQGGSRWRSLGICFDSTADDPSIEGGKDVHEQTIYASAFAGGPKVQASYIREGKWEYPPDGVSVQTITTGREYTLRVQTRDTLINVFLDGKLVLAWQTPIARRDGSLQLMTFDALATIHEFTLAPLASDAVLKSPRDNKATPLTTAAAAQAIAEAQQAVVVAEAAISVAQARVSAVDCRAAAMAAATDSSDDPPTAAQALRRAAAKAERQLEAAQASHALAEAELRAHRVADDKRDAAAKEVAKAREALAKARQRIDEPSEQFTPFVGAKWSATRFRSSGSDDPTIPFPAQSTGRRTALAAWLTHPRHPLTARVAVNHLWTRHFGQPLVATVFDFGRNGSPPTHPALLDWLAAELIDSGWDMKHLHRLMVTSAAYRMSSSAKGADAGLAKDPDNLLLWRRQPGRMESQVVRDSLLALAGNLDVAHGGPPVPSAQQDTSRRRSLYFFHSNNERSLLLSTFDEALVTDCYRRQESIVPQQALALINSQLVLDLAPQIEAELTANLSTNPGQPGDDAFLSLAFTTLLGYEPSEEERRECAAALRRWQELPAAKNTAHAAQYARTQLIWVLLNHNDFVTIR